MKTTATIAIRGMLCLFLAAAFSWPLYAQESDTLDVAPGYETLNIAILGDTLVGGAPKNVNRVYRLERGQYYLLNGELRSIKNNPLRIVAAKGQGPRPIIIPAVSETGAAGRFARPAGDFTMAGLYTTGIDN